MTRILDQIFLLKAVFIGSEIWIAPNLKVTAYKNGLGKIIKAKNLINHQDGLEPPAYF